MKILFIAFLLCASLQTYSQDFVLPQQAQELIDDNMSSDESILADLEISSPDYLRYKNNIRAYQIAKDHIDGGVDVEESIMMAVIELDDEEISMEDYDNNSFPDPEYLRIKNHLIQILEQ